MSLLQMFVTCVLRRFGWEQKEGREWKDGEREMTWSESGREDGVGEPEPDLKKLYVRSLP